MSYTELFKFKKDGNAEDLGEVHNSWRGAMAIWNIMDKRYLPPFTPSWAISFEDRSKEYFRSSDMMGQGLKEVWGLFDNPDVSETDKIVLGSTFDNVTVKRENLEKLIKAFEEFEGETSLKEQSEILKESLEDEDLIAVAWNQTSVNSDCWTNFGGYTEEDEEIPYNILTMEKHWELFNDVK